MRTEVKKVENKTADEMFFELDFNKAELKTIDNEFVAENFTKVYEKRITFNLFEKSLSTYGNITMQELKAINKKVEEYGWNE